MRRKKIRHYVKRKYRIFFRKGKFKQLSITYTNEKGDTNDIYDENRVPSLENYDLKK